MNILFITSWYPSKLYATLGNFVERHALALKSQGHHVLVLHQAFSNKIILPRLKKETVNELEIIHMFTPKVFQESNSLKNILLQKALKKIALLGFTPEIIHGHILYPVGDTAERIADHFQVPLVFSEHWSGFSDFNSSGLDPFILKKAISTAAVCKKIMPVSNSLGKAMQKLGIAGDYRTVYNCVDEKLFFYSPQEKKQTFTFLHISTLDSRIKNVEGILNAYSNFSENSKIQSELIIAGDGDIEKLKNYTLTHHPQLKNIRFAGELAYSEVAKLMRSVQCFILFSNTENLPCVIAEALSAGVPVIGTEVGGIPEMINKQNGILIEPKNEKMLTDAMHKISGNYESFNPRQIEINAHKLYSYSEISRSFESVYREVLEKKI